MLFVTMTGAFAPYGVTIIFITIFYGLKNVFFVRISFTMLNIYANFAASSGGKDEKIFVLNGYGNVPAGELRYSTGTGGKA